MELRREMVFVRTTDTERLSYSSGDEAYLSNQDGGQGGGDGALIASVDPQKPL